MPQLEYRGNQVLVLTGPAGDCIAFSQNESKPVPDHIWDNMKGRPDVLHLRRQKTLVLVQARANEAPSIMDMVGYRKEAAPVELPDPEAMSSGYDTEDETVAEAKARVEGKTAAFFKKGPELVGPAPVVDADPVEMGIAGAWPNMHWQKCKAFVKSCTDTTLLSQLYSIESRPKIHTMLEIRIGELTEAD